MLGEFVVGATVGLRVVGARVGVLEGDEVGALLGEDVTVAPRNEDNTSAT